MIKKSHTTLSQLNAHLKVQGFEIIHILFTKEME